MFPRSPERVSQVYRITTDTVCWQHAGKAAVTAVSSTDAGEGTFSV
jgi:hypothetical protein